MIDEPSFVPFPSSVNHRVGIKVEQIADKETLAHYRERRLRVHIEINLTSCSVCHIQPRAFRLLPVRFVHRHILSRNPPSLIRAY